MRPGAVVLEPLPVYPGHADPDAGHGHCRVRPPLDVTPAPEPDVEPDR